MFLSSLLKDLLNLHYKGKCEIKLGNFFSLIFQWLKHDIYQCWWHQGSFEEGSCRFLQKYQNKNMTISTGNHINHEQIHHVRNN